MTWAIAASLGLAAILSQYAQALVLMRILGGLYLLYLAWRAFRSAASKIDPLGVTKATASLKRTFLMGYARNAHPYDFFNVRLVVAGAERVKPETREAWMEKFGLPR